MWSMQILSYDNMQINVIRKKIKNYYLSVLANGTIRVSIPLRSTEKAILAFIESKSLWLKQKIAQSNISVLQTKRAYKNGETFYFQGQGYQLQLISLMNVTPYIELAEGKKLNLYSHHSILTPKYTISTWYKAQLDQQLRVLLPKWEQIIGVKANSYQIKTLKSRWGSCHISTKVITINLELMKMPCECLEYVVVHELVHLLEASHNHRFKSLMDQYLPSWREIKKRLNDFIYKNDIGMV